MFGSFAMLSKKELLIFNHIKDISIFFFTCTQRVDEKKKNNNNNV